MITFDEHLQIKKTVTNNIKIEFLTKVQNQAFYIFVVSFQSVYEFMVEFLIAEKNQA